jgi:hypothetical protein
MLDQLVALQAKGTLVTRLFRGKTWIHKSTARATDPLLPPDAYKQFVKSGIYDIRALGTKAQPIPKGAKAPYGDAAYHDDRQFLVLNQMVEVDAHYAAMISCADLLQICRNTNRAVEDLFLANTFAYADDVSYQHYFDSDDKSQFFRSEVLPFRLDKVVAEAFPNAKVYLLPVLFDHVADFLSGRVSAVVPAAVNFQTLGKVVMVPRPYGPRLRVADAVAFTNGVIAKLGYPKTAIDEKYRHSSLWSLLSMRNCAIEPSGDFAR